MTIQFNNYCSVLTAHGSMFFTMNIDEIDEIIFS